MVGIFGIFHDANRHQLGHRCDGGGAHPTWHGQRNRRILLCRRSSRIQHAKTCCRKWRHHFYRLFALLLHFQNYGGTLQWSSDIQSYVLASFYWAYIVSQVVGGLATQKLGTKRVFGYAQLVTALCSLSIPWGSETHYSIVILLRSIQGFASVSLPFLFFFLQLYSNFDM